jgi:hypothetical protein
VAKTDRPTKDKDKDKEKASKDICRYVNKSDKVFWDMTPCNVVGIYSHFGGIYCPHLQDKRLLVYPEDSERVS